MHPSIPDGQNMRQEAMFDARQQILGLIPPLYEAAKRNPGGAEARLLLAIGCDVVTDVVEEIFLGPPEPDAKLAIEAARQWSKGEGDIEFLEKLNAGPMIEFYHRQVPADRHTRQLLPAEQARMQTAEMVHQLVKAARYLDPG